MGIYVWGIGCGTGQLMDGGLELDRIDAFVDSRPYQSSFMGKKVISPRELAGRDYDLIIVSTRMAEEIEEICLELGISMEKVLFLKNNYHLEDRNRSYAQAEKILGSELLRSLRQRYRAMRLPDWLDDGPLLEREVENDYIRVKTLQAISGRLRSVPGACAELGVYRGSFARCINALMPERKLYLFDSFEGFEEKELRQEMARGRGGEGFAAAHRDTSVERVLSIMPAKENIIIKQGWFPQSLDGLEASFCLVSLDADFEESSYEGLKYFVPRMEKGGYIMLHDYNNPALPGVKSALERYEKENGRLTVLPLPDLMGTRVLCF